jgi:hypothetical protein
MKKNVKIKEGKYETKLCNDSMTFQECELAILRGVIDEHNIIQGKTMAMNENTKKMIQIVEEFLFRKKLVCYGGTAINNILPKSEQFYNPDIEIPDYDFFSPTALDDTKELADIFYNEGFKDVEAKSGVHLGTYKVFVNFIPIADITFMDKDIYEGIFRESIVVAGIHYSPPDYLRMGIYLELSRPNGDTTRWEKIYKRLELLNKHYPMITKKDCEMVNFQRKMESHIEDSEKLYILVRDNLISQGVVFFGGFATSLYSKYMTQEERHLVEKIPDFDVLSENPGKTALIIQENLERNNFKKVKIIEYPNVGDIIPEHVEVKVGKETIVYIYKPVACHSYNSITFEGKEINVATIDTILAFYLSFIYAKLPYNKERLLCMAKFLFDVENNNKLSQKGLLKRFSMNCYGRQKRLEDIRMEKAEKYKEFANKDEKSRASKEYEMWFLKYIPGEEKKNVKNGKYSKNGKNYNNSNNSRREPYYNKPFYEKEIGKGKRRATKRAFLNKKKNPFFLI